MNIKILGTGCAKCQQQMEEVKKALSEKNMEASVEKVEDIPSIMGYGVMSTPAVVIDEKVVSSGKVAKADEVINYL